MNDHTMHTDSDALAADVADLEESLYEFHLRLSDMIGATYGTAPAGSCV
ncbi:hypothetical protein [Type-D symbiont of Plautia stali]|nr:hypothetical protein [Type-D symbiont of Plautia stali]